MAAMGLNHELRRLAASPASVPTRSTVASIESAARNGANAPHPKPTCQVEYLAVV